MTECVVIGCSWKLWEDHLRFPTEFEVEPQVRIKMMEGGRRETYDLFKWVTWNAKKPGHPKKEKLALCQEHHNIVLERLTEEFAADVREMEATDEYYSRLAREQRFSGEALHGWSGSGEVGGSIRYSKRLASPWRTSRNKDQQS